MWRISALLWSAVEWCEKRAERRRVRYFTKWKLRSAEPHEVQRPSFFARLRSAAALFMLLFVSRH
jgi:hypothetical protein